MIKQIIVILSIILLFILLAFLYPVLFVSFSLGAGYVAIVYLFLGLYKMSK